jgi:Acetyltransferase (GNAT) domain
MAEAAVATQSRAEEQVKFSIVHEFPTPELELAWRDCLDRVECPSHYNAPEYFRETSLANERRFAVLAMQQGRVVGVLTGGYERKHAICGLISRPQVCLDSTVDAHTATDALARGLLADARDAKLLSVYSWRPLSGFEERGFRYRSLEGPVVLDLTQGPEALFKQLNKKRRNCIRAAQRQKGLEIFQPSDRKDIEAFYQVYSAWYGSTRKKIEGKKVPFDVFEQRFHLAGNVRMFLARVSGNVIAGITLRFFPGGLIEYSNNSSRAEYLHLRPNDLLVWHAIEWACREGFPRFSLGGMHRFLREFGGTVTPIYRYRLDRTWLRRHDRCEQLADRGREKLREMPKPVEKVVRRVLGKNPI